MATYKTLYIIPSECPYEEALVASSPETWETVRFSDFLDLKVAEDCTISWACAGCTRGIGHDEISCEQRKCGIGG